MKQVSLINMFSIPSSVASKYIILILFESSFIFFFLLKLSSLQFIPEGPMKSTNKPKTPTKHNRSIEQQSPAVIAQNCHKILTQQTSQQITKYLIENKLTSFTLKNEKCLNLLNMSRQIFSAMIIENEPSEEFMNRVMGIYKNNGKKVYEFCRCLRHFAEKDYEFDYILSVAKAKNTQSISFYLKCRSVIQQSFLNKAKKQLIINIVGETQQWFKIVQKIFKTVQKQTLIQLFTDTIKYHYLSIKKNQNQELNGAEILRICQIIQRNIKQNNNQLFSFDERDQMNNNYYNESTSRFGMGDADERDRQDERMSMPNKAKQKQVKRLFQKNVVNGLESQDRQLIRILSYKDNNIARLLQKKHEKMIELIVDDVQTMRRSIEQEKQKYMELWKQKQDILKFVDHINHLSLSYVANDSIENQDKLLKAIEGFNHKFKPNTHTSMQLKKIKENKKNKRLIQLIQREQRQKC